MCNGMLAGMVAVTASCAFVSPFTAIFIGSIAGILVVSAAMFLESRVRVDDPVGAISVHAVNGLWGIVALGLFANGSYGDGLNGVAGPVRGLFAGDPGQLYAQLIGAGTNIVYAGAMSAVTFLLVDRWLGNRVAAQDEIDGLDLPEMGIPGYATDYPNPETMEASPVELVEAPLDQRAWPPMGGRRKAFE